MSSNGISVAPLEGKEKISRADEAEVLLNTIRDLIIPFIRSADSNLSSLPSNKTSEADQNGSSKDPNGACKDQTLTLLTPHPPKDLTRLLAFKIPSSGQGIPGLSSLTKRIQTYSVNTWDPGFLDKLYHSPSPIGLVADTLLTSLNTNVHTFQVSPALTIIEKHTCRALASAFGFHGRWVGGVSQSGGSAANQTSIVVARNTLFPETKARGYEGRRFVLFTSEHGHYSLEKAAQISGFGSEAVRSVPVDGDGRMRGDVLDAAITEAKGKGETVFYVNATAGTTVLGSFDALEEIAEVCQKHGVWMHVDASWGGPLVFSDAQRWKLRGIDRADSIAMCPHKMMGVPLSCSVLLGRDLRQFHRAMTLPAGYLFHDENEQEVYDEDERTNSSSTSNNTPDTFLDDDFNDLADLTPQCGRRGDILKLALSLVYHGTSYYQTYIDNAFATTAYFTTLLEKHPDFTLVSPNPPPCLQVCFYYKKKEKPAENSRLTARVKRELVGKGFMIDYAPGPEGKFFRVVINGRTTREVVERLLAAFEEVAKGLEF